MTTAGVPADGDQQRRPRGRPRVPFDRIVETALLIVDEEGPDALSMRNLAQRLDTGTATLYRAVAGRTELIGHVIDRVFGDIDLDAVAPNTGIGWQEACLAAGQQAFAALRRHPRLAPLLAERVPTGPNAMMQRERLLAAFLAGGFSGKTASRAYATLARFILGFAIQLPTADADNDEVSTLYRRLDPACYPATFAVADLLPTARIEDEFEFGLRLFVTGLESLRTMRA